MARLLIISDLHYENMVFRGIDERRAFTWLLEIVDRVKPDVLLSAGDWGRALKPENMEALKKLVRVLTIYGNHENMLALTATSVLMEPGRVYDVFGLRVAGISGIVSEKPRVKDGVPRRTPAEFLREARLLARRGPVDVLLLHQPPYIPELFPGIVEDIGSRVALQAMELIKPRLVVVGHMHMGYRKFTLNETIVVHIDSSLARREYIVLEDRRAIVYRNDSILDSFTL